MSSVWNTAENLLLAPSMGLPDNRVSSLPEASETVSMAMVFFCFFQIDSSVSFYNSHQKLNLILYVFWAEVVHGVGLASKSFVNSRKIGEVLMMSQWALVDCAVVYGVEVTGIFSHLLNLSDKNNFVDRDVVDVEVQQSIYRMETHYES